MAIPRMVFTGRKTELLDTEFEIMQRQGRVLCHCLETFSNGDPRYAGYTAVHVTFDEIYRNYSKTRFVKGAELLILLVLYQCFGLSYNMLITISMWSMVVIWFFLAPFLVNPLMFEQKVFVQDLEIRWGTWMRTNYGGPARSWESWWEQEQEKEHNKSSWGLCGTIIKVLFAVRFFFYHRGLVHRFSSQVYKLSWIVVLTILVVIMAMSYWRETSRDGTPRRYYYLLTKAYMIYTVLYIPYIPTVLGLMPWKDVSLLAFAFLVAGWGLLLIAQALGSLLKQSKLIWFMVKSVAKYYDNAMAIIVHIQIQILAGLLLFSKFQTPMLCNEVLTARIASILCV